MIIRIVAAWILGSVICLNADAAPTQQQWNALNALCPSCAYAAKLAYQENPTKYPDLTLILHSQEYVQRLMHFLQLDVDRNNSKWRRLKKINKLFLIYERHVANSG